MERDPRPGEVGFLQWRKEHVEFWRRKNNGAKLEVKPIHAARSRIPGSEKMLRVREVGRKTWQTWHPDVLRDRAEKEI